ncbi:MAG: efflux RND transporter periplasmic adaptor subunit [Verrucomicrobia bacterium]|nr:efflux RND transporter periplasmic adaptor subunit [Verrucomicrobiota bacterium]
MNKLNVLLTAAVLLNGVLFFGTGCSKKSDTPSEASKAPAAIPVVVAQAEQKEFDVEISAFGHVSSYNRVEVKPRVSGHIIEIPFKEGQEVKKGDLLFKIDPRKTEASLAQAKATLAQAEAKLTNALNNYERAKGLFDKKLISTEEMDSATTALLAAKATVASGEASLKDIELTLEFTDVTAPITGRTGAIQTDLGNVVSAGSDTLVTINEMSPIGVNFSLAERFMPQLRRILNQPQSTVQVYDGATDAFIAEGKLDFMDNHVDRATGMVALSARFENADQALWPGQFVKIVMDLEQYKDAIVIPSIAIQNKQDGEQFVYVVKADNTVEIRDITVGEQRGEESLIKEGLAAGETIVTDGHLRLTEKSTVKAYHSLDEAVQQTVKQ